MEAMEIGTTFSVKSGIHVVSGVSPETITLLRRAAPICGERAYVVRVDSLGDHREAVMTESTLAEWIVR